MALQPHFVNQRIMLNQFTPATEGYILISTDFQKTKLEHPS